MSRARDNLDLGMKRVALLLGCAVAAASCGGGGGGQAVVQPSTTYRANVPGDSWSYAVNIDFGQFGSYTGTLSQSLSNDTYNGAPSIKQTQQFDLMLKTGPSNVTSYSEFSPTGQLLAETINASWEVVSSDTFNVPSTPSIGASSSGVISFASGLTTTETYKIVGAAPVATAAGSYNCWIVDQSAVRSDGVSDKFTSWVAPETGNFVVLKDTTNNGDGTGYTYTARLTSLVAATTNRRPFVHSIEMVAKAIRTMAKIPNH